MGSCCGGKESRLEENDGYEGYNPLSARKKICCTDVAFLVLFLCFWSLLGFIAFHSIRNGDAKRLLYGYDSFGNTCNQQYNRPIENLSLSGWNTLGKPNVFFMSVFDPLKSMQVCVSDCPNENLETVELVKQFTKKTNISLCKYDIDVEETQNYMYQKNGPCPELGVHNSFSLLFRCVPNPNKSNLNKSQEILKKFVEVFELDDLFRKVLHDVYVCWREMIALCGIAVVIAFLVVLVMRFVASVVVWLIVVLAVIGSLVGTGFLWWTWNGLPSEGAEDQRSHIPIINVDVKNKATFLVFSLVATVFTVILLLILLAMRKRIALVVALFHEAGKCLIAIPFLLIQPLWTFIVLFIFLVYWVWILAYIATLGTPTASSRHGFESVEYKLDGFHMQFWWIHAIGLIWTSEFILACQQFVITGAVVNWYFHPDKSRLNCPLGGAIKAFSILTSNVLRVAAINSVGAFVLFLGKVGVMASTCAIATVWLKSIETLHYFAIPVFFISIFSFLIAHCFLCVYEMVVDSLLICFCEDSRLNNGVPAMNASLREFVSESSQQIDSIERGHTSSSELGLKERTRH